jgi:hypothetical protein
MSPPPCHRCGGQSLSFQSLSDAKPRGYLALAGQTGNQTSVIGGRLRDTKTLLTRRPISHGDRDTEFSIWTMLVAKYA